MKLGIVGNGGIVTSLLDEVAAEHFLDPTALCVRPNSAAKGELLAGKYGIKTVYTDYDIFLESADCDFVYIGVINSEHYHYTKKALMAGRHVICEKPFTNTRQEAEELVAIALQKNLFLFEAITTIHSPNFQRIKEKLVTLGQIKVVQCNFSQYSSRYDRYLTGDVAPVFNPRYAGGALVDINVYNIHFVVGLFGEPEAVQYYPNRGFNGIDTSGVLIMKYPDFVVTCTGAKDSESPNHSIIQGDRGTIELPGANECRCVTISYIHGEEEAFDAQQDGRMACEMKAFDKIRREQDYDTCEALLNHSLQVMSVLDAAKRSCL